MTASAGRRRVAVLLAVAGIAATGSYLRVWQLTWGLARREWFPDEDIWVFRLGPKVLGAPGGFLSPILVNPYPPLLAYLTHAVAVALGALHVPLAGIPETILVARGVGVAVSVLGVALVGIAGAAMYGVPVGLVAAGLMAVIPQDVTHVHYVSTDGLLTVLFTLTVLAMLALARSATLQAAAAAGALCGLAFAAKYPGLVLLSPIGLVIAFRASRARSVRLLITLGAAAVAGLAVGVSVGCPPCLAHPHAVLDAIRVQAAIQSRPATFIGDHLEPSLGWYGHRYLYQLVASFPFMLGWPVYGLALAGIAVAARRRAIADGVLLAAMLPYFLVVAASPVTPLRYLMPLVPGLVVLAARAVVVLPLRPAVRATLLGLTIAYTFVLSLSLVAGFSRAPQEDVARWIAMTRPDLVGKKRGIAIPQRFYEYLGLRAPFARAGLALDPVPTGHWFDEPHEVFVLPGLHEVAIARDAAEHVAGAPDLERLKSGSAGYREGARWRSWYLQRSFYEWLDPRFGIGPGGGEFTVYVRDTEARGTEH